MVILKLSWAWAGFGGVKKAQLWPDPGWVCDQRGWDPVGTVLWESALWRGLCRVREPEPGGNVEAERLKEYNKQKKEGIWDTCRDSNDSRAEWFPSLLSWVVMEKTLTFDGYWVQLDSADCGRWLLLFLSLADLSLTLKSSFVSESKHTLNKYCLTCLLRNACKT